MIWTIRPLLAKWNSTISAALQLASLQRRDSDPTTRMGVASLRGLRAELHNQGMLDWNDIRHLLAVAREGSALAARALRVNQSAVDRHLSAIERELGCKLVGRHPTGYRLTELGKELKMHAERMEESAAALKRHIAASEKDMTGPIRLTWSSFTPPYSLRHR
jgi:hypothetical protein